MSDFPSSRGGTVEIPCADCGEPLVRPVTANPLMVKIVPLCPKCKLAKHEKLLGRLDLDDLMEKEFGDG